MDVMRGLSFYGHGWLFVVNDYSDYNWAQVVITV